MNRISPVFFLGLMLPCSGLKAQSPAASGSTPPTQTATSSQSNHDRNIQAYIDLLRSDLRNSKSQVVGQVMQLDSDQATKFWPIYKEFESDFAKIGDRSVTLVRTYGDNYDRMTNEMADRLATELLTIEQDRTDLKRQYYQKFKKALDPTIAARFLQVENLLENLVNLQVASQLPIMPSSQTNTH